MRRFIFPLLSFSILLGIFACTEKKEAYLNTDLSFEERTDDLVGKLTLQEKVDLLIYHSPAVERMGIPAYNWWNECLHGVARAGIATVYPQAIGMAAMWDDKQMFDIATAISDEARAKHHAFAANDKRGIYQGLTFWTPNINIFRDPRWGRGMETYGEDPYLTGELAVDFIQGLQGDDPKYLKLVATAKHFVAHSGPEWNRHSYNAKPNKLDFYETYTPHFKKAVQEAGVYSVMCAYNRLNDLPCCGSHFVDSLLRVSWGFKGYIVSDCWAIDDFFEKGHHEVVPTEEQAAAMAIKAGTDLNCGETYKTLIDAVKQGLVSEAEIDVSVKRIILARMKLGMFDDPSQVKWAQIPYNVVDSKEHQLLAREAAKKSMVLLKNDHNILPFSKSLKNVAVIGPNADNIDVLLGNYNGFPSNPITPFVGIRNKLPNSTVTYSQGCRLANEMPYLKHIPSEVLFTDSTKKESGLKAEYFNNDSLQGTPLHVITDKTVNFIWWDKAPFTDMNASQFSVRWTGVLVPPTTGDYVIGGEGQTGLSIYLDGKKIIDLESEHNMSRDYETFRLTAGKKYDIKVEYHQNQSEYANIKLLWDTPNQQLLADAIENAKQADIVVLCLGLSPSLEGEEMKVKVAGFEGGDRTTIDLPASQTQLAKAIMALNKPTVLVLLNGSALAINWEAQNIPAILEAWYPGQAGGAAIADILFGDYNPAGRLPVTFYKSTSQLPDFEDYGMKGRTYRFFNDEPLFAFGHGLSYSTFVYSNLIVDNEIEAGKDVTLSVDVKNTGTLDGDEVVQLYVSLPDAKTAVPIRSLQGFKRIGTKAGQSQTVTFTLKPNQMGVYNTDGTQTVQPGKIVFAVGGCQPDKTNTSKVVMGSSQIVGEFLLKD